MDYMEVNISIEPSSDSVAEVLVAYLAEIGYDSFATIPSGVQAYIPLSSYSQDQLNGAIGQIPQEEHKLSFTSTEIPDQNWNRRWESNFNPISIGSHCLVRAPFHPPQDGYSLELVIEPKMAFGTGHHQTTWLMANALFQLPIAGKTVLDMGCGTGILAIIASKLGAAKVCAVDIDHWAYENTIENAQANGCNSIEVLIGDASLLAGRRFDIILANINLNVLTADMGQYYSSLNQSGLLALSGFYTHDIPAIQSSALGVGLQEQSRNERESWVTIVYLK